MSFAPGQDSESGAEALDIHPSVTVLNHLIEAKQWERLLTMARERLAQKVEDEAGHRCAAVALIQLRQSKEAKQHVDWLLQKDPENPFHYVLAAQIAVQQSAFRQARRHLERGLALDPQYPTLHRLIATVMSVLGKVKQAQTHADKAKQLDAGSVETWRTAEFVFRANSGIHGHWKERIEALQNALQHDPEDPVVLWQVGTLLQDLERPAAAEHWLSRSLAAQPTCAVVILDWKETFERKSFIYRCLSFPWRSLHAFRVSFDSIAQSKPWLLLLHLLAIKFWTAVILWWLGTLMLLAPVGWVARYFMILHPAFDLRFLPHSWIRHQSKKARIAWMMTTFAIATGLAILLTSPEFVGFYALLSLAMFILQATATGLFILVRRTMSPSPPRTWLSSQ